MGPWDSYGATRQLGGAAGPPIPRPVTVADSQRRLGEKPGQFATDLSARAHADVGDLNAAVARVNAHPMRLMNAPDVLGAVAGYASNAFGLAPAAALDQLTGPAMNAFNGTFGTHYDYRNATDQLLNAAGLIAGAERPFTAAKGSLRSVPPDAPALTAADPGPPPSLADRLTAVAPNLTVLPDDEFAARDRLQQARLPQLLQPYTKLQFDEIAREPVIGPYLDDPDFPGHTGTDLSNIRSHLADLADRYRPQGPEGETMADEIGHLSDNLMSMAARQHPEFAEALAGPRPWNPLGLAVPGADEPPSGPATGAQVLNLDSYRIRSNRQAAAPESAPPAPGSMPEAAPSPAPPQPLTLTVANDNSPLPSTPPGFWRDNPPSHLIIMPDVEPSFPFGSKVGPGSRWPPSPAAAGANDAAGISTGPGAPPSDRDVAAWNSLDEDTRSKITEAIRNYLANPLAGPPPGPASGPPKRPTLSIVGKDTNAFTGDPTTGPTPPDR
jgi:hypothetical protein